MKRDLLKAQQLAQSGILCAPNSFKLAPVNELIETCNGCGASGSWFRPPATICRTSIISACIVHDWQFSHGKTIEDKDEADRTFLNNMIRLIELDKKYWYKPTITQCVIAYLYYLAVHIFGGPAFWSGKN